MVENVLEEQNLTRQELFTYNVVSVNTFSKYRQHYPSLKTAIKIVNYLKVSLDYLFEFSNINSFNEYKYESLKFYNNLILYIKNKKISLRQFCKELGYSKDNIQRWKNGTQPSIQRLLEIANYFNCSIDDLIA